MYEAQESKVAELQKLEHKLFDMNGSPTSDNQEEYENYQKLLDEVNLHDKKLQKLEQILINQEKRYALGSKTLLGMNPDAKKH
ncbi:MAG TPA: hypothetical protein PLK76_03545 [bacterium]|jgi:hypothetical protein|nr:hypothetical protein [bacterium]